MSNGDLTRLHEYIIDILKSETNEDKHIRKSKLIELLRSRYDVEPVRGTVYSKIDYLITAGYDIRSESDGIYLVQEENEFSDGELRVLVDSVLYSDILPEKYSADIIRKLAKLGTDGFRKNMEKLAVKAKNINKSANCSIIMNVEDIQQAIYENKQLSCNYIAYDKSFRQVKTYDSNIIVNPYELAFSDGKYYLVCSQDNFNKLSFMRVDRITDIEILDSSCVESEYLKKIKNDNGIQNYIYSQPQLKGGISQRFILLCYRDSLNDVYDAFANNFHIVNNIGENYDDPETVTVTVETTYQAMKYWAVIHAENVVVVSPAKLRDEIRKSLKSAEHTYFKSGRPARIRSMTAQSIDEAIHEMNVAGIKSLRYMGRSENKTPEKIYLGKTDFSGIKSLSIWHCNLIQDKNIVFPDVSSLHLIRSAFDVKIFDSFPSLDDITITGACIESLDFIKKFKNIKRLVIAECDNLKDFSALYELSSLRRFETDSRNFTEQDYQKLLLKFPDCKIFRQKTRLKK